MSKFLNLVGKFNYLLEADDQENQVGDDLNQVGDDLQKAVETPTQPQQPPQDQTPQDTSSALPQFTPEEGKTLAKFALIYLKRNKDRFDSVNYPEMVKLLTDNSKGDDSILPNLKEFLKILPGSKVVEDKDPATLE
jgi:hypothetical protein